LLEKGKPRESVGRKATDLNPLKKQDMAAGLPSEGSISGCWISHGQLNPAGGVADGNSKGFITTSKVCFHIFIQCSHATP
jgi:hypothetical protein